MFMYVCINIIFAGTLLLHCPFQVIFYIIELFCAIKVDGEILT